VIGYHDCGKLLSMLTLVSSAGNLAITVVKKACRQVRQAYDIFFRTDPYNVDY